MPPSLAAYRKRIDPPRSIVLQTRGRSHGATTRLVGPGDIGALIKPFIFLDYFDVDPQDPPQFGLHPHSGVATLTLILSGHAGGGLGW